MRHTVGHMTPLLHALAGFGTGISLIAAIGAQNAFVLRQGLRREHVLPIVVICAVSDAALITAGVAGVGALIQQLPMVLSVVSWLGVLFLVTYGVIAARRAFAPGALTADVSGPPMSLAQALAICLAFTWLNPHVYLDTVLLVGSIASGHGDPGRWYFGAGAVVSSLVWFVTLGFGARLLRGVFARPAAWRVLDAVIALVMVGLGANLAIQATGSVLAGAAATLAIAGLAAAFLGWRAYRARRGARTAGSVEQVVARERVGVPGVGGGAAGDVEGEHRVGLGLGDRH